MEPSVGLTPVIPASGGQMQSRVWPGLQSAALSIHKQTGFETAINWSLSVGKRSLLPHVDHIECSRSWKTSATEIQLQNLFFSWVIHGLSLFPLWTKLHYVAKVGLKSQGSVCLYLLSATTLLGLLFDEVKKNIFIKTILFYIHISLLYLYI